MNWKENRLDAVLVSCHGGIWGDSEESPNAGVIRTTNISDDHKIDLERVAWRNIPERQLSGQVLLDGDIVMTKSNSLERIGSCGLIKDVSKRDEKYVAANFCQRLRFDNNIIDSEYAYWWLTSQEIQNTIKSLATGTSSSLQNINGKKISSLTIRYPNLDEQKRIAVRIRDCVDRIDEAKKILPTTAKDLIELKHSLLFDEIDRSNQYVLMSDITYWVQDTEKVIPDQVYEFAGVRSFGRGVFAGPTKKTDDFKYPQLRRVREKDFIFPKLMAWEGAFGIVPKNLAGRVVSPEFMIFRAREEKVLPEVIDTYFRSPFCLQDVRARSTGSNQRRRRLNPKEFLKIKMPLPTMKRQLELREVYRFEQQVQATRVNREAEFNAIKNSVLRKAFAGEL
jgi:type I restriction enzyme S subunit